MQASSSKTSSLHGKEIVDAFGRRWRAFAPGWRLWLWLGFFIRRIVLFRLPGHLVPFIGWVPAPRVAMTIGMPPRIRSVRAERVESQKTRRARAAFKRSLGKGRSRS